MKVDIIADEMEAIGGGSSKVANLFNGLTSKRIDVRIFGFKSKHSHFSNYNIIAKSTGSSILNSVILLIRSPFIGIRKDSIIHTLRIVHALPFLWRRNPIICEERGRITEEMEMRHSKLLISVYNLIEKICLRYVDKVIVVDPGTYDYLKRKHKVDKGKIEVIPIGVDLAQFRPYNEGDVLSRYGIDRRKKVTLFVGRIDPVKNLAMLLKAFKEVIERTEECNLILVGKGSEEERLRRLAAEMDISDRVFFVGFVPHQHIPEILSASDVFAFTSLNEGSPNVTKEAVACGLPVISTKVGDVADYVKNGVNGYIVDDFDPSNFAAYLIKALENNEQLRQGCLKTRDSLSMETMIERYEKAYQKLVQNKLNS